MIWTIEAAQSDQPLTAAEKQRKLLEIVPGPDFPTGGYIVGRQGIQQAYLTGRGSVLMRAKAEIEVTKKGDRQSIIITEIPYQVNKARLIERIAELVREKTIEGISDIRDESDRRRHAHRDRAEARRGRRGRAEQPLQAHPAADHLRRDHAGHRRRPPEDPDAGRVHRQLHRVPARGGAAAHPVRAAQGRGARPHPRGPEDRARPPGRGDRADPRSPGTRWRLAPA